MKKTPILISTGLVVAIVFIVGCANVDKRVTSGLSKAQSKESYRQDVHQFETHLNKIQKGWTKAHVLEHAGQFDQPGTYHCEFPRQVKSGDPIQMVIYQIGFDKDDTVNYIHSYSKTGVRK
jgi:hypothetical protein